MTLKKIQEFIFGPPRNPFSAETRKHIALAAFFAWVGLGADGLSSANYGPEEAFVALGGHTSMAIFLAISTAVTVFIISLAYIQVIELFPNGGGGYRVASRLLGPRAGLVSGSALIVDYVLTIAISVASATDAVYSLLPIEYQTYKIYTEFALIGVLIILNMRGIKESIKILMPIFLGFVVTHLFIIIYGIVAHSYGLSNVIPQAINDTKTLSDEVGWFVVLTMFLKAFSLGGGTYTGLESVSNNVHTLAQPRERTGKLTMIMVAISLATMAAGVILLYLLWNVQKVPGQTLNASAFRLITADWEVMGHNISSYAVTVLMLFAAGLLFVAANSGFLAGPAVIANMASDRWMPHLFSSLSSRLVTKNGIILMGGLAMGAVYLTGGVVHILVVLYSINVFLTFTLSLLGLCRYWLRRRKARRGWLRKLLIAFIGLIVCASILIVTTIEKFTSGGWMTILVTSSVIALGYFIRKHYEKVEKRLLIIEDQFPPVEHVKRDTPALDHTKPTAVIFCDESFSTGMNCLLWIQKLFPSNYSNFIFIGVGEIDSANFSEEGMWQKRRRDFKQMLKTFVAFCHSYSQSATYYIAHGTDVIDELTKLSEQVLKDFPNCVFFGSKLIFDKHYPFHQLLHNQTAYLMQRRLHMMGQNMIIMPMKI